MADVTNPETSAKTSAITGTPSKPAHAHKRSEHRKSSDPFLNLDNNINSPIQAVQEEDGASTTQSESLLSDLILTPLHMITFVLSLSVIDYRQRQWRLSQHASDHETFWFRLTHWSWLHPEPYQDSRDGTWKHNDNTALQSPPNTDFQGWYTQKKHRAVTRMEISDAFDMRGRVILALLAWAVVGAFGLTFATKRLYGWISA